MDLIVSLLTMLAASFSITDAKDLSDLQQKIEAMDVKQQEELKADLTSGTSYDPAESPAISVTIIDKK